MDNGEFFDDSVARDSEETVERTGNKKRAALLSGIGAIAGAFLGDIFYGREHVLHGEVNYVWYEDDGTKVDSVYSIHSVARDRGGLIEDSIGSDQFGDKYDIVERVKETYDVNGFPHVTTDDNIGIFTEDYMRSHIDGLYQNVPWDSFTDTTTYDGAMIGSAVGGGAGYGADYILKKRNAKDKDKEY